MTTKKWIVRLSWALLIIPWVIALARADVSTATVVNTVTVFTPPGVSSNTPLAITSLVDGFHLLDNGSLLTLRDLKNGVWAMGSSSAFYKKYYLSADAMLGYIPDTPSANAFYALNGRFWAGQLLYEKVWFIQALADKLALTSTLLQYGTVGAWGTRDFQYGIWRYGWDAGVTIKFSALGL